MEELCFNDSVQKFIEIQGWLLLTFFIRLHSQFSYRCRENVIHQRDSKNEWLLLSVTFTAKLGLVFVLTLKNAFSLSYHFKDKRNSIGFL